MKPATSAADSAAGHLLRAPVIGALAVACVVGLAWVLNAGVPFRNDFAAYWPVGRLLLEGRNPYDAEAIHALQRAAGDTLGGDSVVRYPPWAIPLLLPTAILPYAPAWYGWIALQLLAALWAARLVQRLIEGKCTTSVSGPLIALLFTPTWIMALGGQISGLLVLAAAALLRSLDERRILLAGVLLGVLATKPHLFVPTAVIVLLWSYREGRLPVIAAALLTATAGALLAMSLRPTIFADYADFVGSRAPTGYLPPTLGGLIRALVDPTQFWLQWIPLAVSLPLLWLASHRWKDDWSWPRHGPGVLAVGILVAPYALVHDLVLLIPCLVQIGCIASHWGGRSARLRYLGGLALASLAIWIGQIQTGTSFVQFWVTPLVVFSCWLASRQAETPCVAASEEDPPLRTDA